MNKKSIILRAEIVSRTEILCLIDMLEQLPHYMELSNKQLSAVSNVIRKDIVARMKKTLNSKPSDNNDFKKVCPACKENYEHEDMHFAYDIERGMFCRVNGKPISKS